MTATAACDVAIVGGVPLDEVDYRTMASRRVPGLYLCGELLDCDGRIGGFNFQWAWATGYLAGRAAAEGECGLEVLESRGRCPPPPWSPPATGEELIVRPLLAAC